MGDIIVVAVTRTIQKYVGSGWRCSLAPDTLKPYLMTKTHDKDADQNPHNS
jgi:hypothetical protein